MTRKTTAEIAGMMAQQKLNPCKDKIKSKERVRKTME